MAVTPKYDKRSQSQGKRRGVGGSQAKMRGASEPPTNPTGRHVVTNVDGIKNGGSQVVHWCPSAGVEWTCPSCHEVFIRDEDQKGSPWRARIDHPTT